MPFTDDMNLEQPSEGAQNAGNSYNDNSDKLERRTIKGTLGETVAQYKWVFFDWSSQKFKEGFASGSQERRVFGLTLTAGILNDQVLICYMGRVQNALWSFTQNGELYLSNSSGDPTPSAPANKVVVGLPVGSDEMIVFPPYNASL